MHIRRWWRLLPSNSPALLRSAQPILLVKQQIQVSRMLNNALICSQHLCDIWRTNKSDVMWNSQLATIHFIIAVCDLATLIIRTNMPVLRSRKQKVVVAPCCSLGYLSLPGPTQRPLIFPICKVVNSVPASTRHAGIAVKTRVVQATEHIAYATCFPSQLRLVL